MENNDDDCYSDDFDFDSLPPGTLYELEQSAYQATQPPVTQHNHTVPDSIAHVGFDAQAGRTIQRSTSLNGQITRLHSKLTNEYDTLEVGELEAEIHDNVGGQSALPSDHQVTVSGHGWPVSDGNGDLMDMDNYLHGGSNELNVRLEQVISDSVQSRLGHND